MLCLFKIFKMIYNLKRREYSVTQRRDGVRADKNPAWDSKARYGTIIIIHKYMVKLFIVYGCIIFRLKMRYN